MEKEWLAYAAIKAVVEPIKYKRIKH